MNNAILGIIVLFLVAGFSAVEAGQGSADRAWIDLREADGALTLQAMCEADQDGPLDYQLQVIKTGPSGNSNSSQGGRQQVEKGVQKKLATLRLGINHGDRYQVNLKLFRNGTLTAQQEAKKEI